MKCKDCGTSLQAGHENGLVLECEACAKFPADCVCRRRLGHTPHRWVHCRGCGREFVGPIDTTKKGWRAQEV